MCLPCLSSGLHCNPPPPPHYPQLCQFFDFPLSRSLCTPVMIWVEGEGTLDITRSLFPSFTSFIVSFIRGFMPHPLSSTTSHYLVNVVEGVVHFCGPTTSCLIRVLPYCVRREVLRICLWVFNLLANPPSLSLSFLTHIMPSFPPLTQALGVDD